MIIKLKVQSLGSAMNKSYFKRMRAANHHAFLCIVFVSLSMQVFAQPTFSETEPNNRPSDANQVSGETLIMASMEAGDQDGFLWTVSDVDAQKRWSFELSGISGSLTIVDVFRIEWAENGVDVTATHKLLGFGSRDGTKPASLDDLIFEPGEYLLGVAHAGGSGGAFRPPVGNVSFGDPTVQQTSDEQSSSGYRLRIQEGASLNLKGRPKDNNSKQDAQSLRINAEFSSFVGPSENWYQFEINTKQANQDWVLGFQEPVGRKSQAQLLNSSGDELGQQQSDSQGKLQFPDLSLSEGSYFLKVTSELGDAIKAVSFQSTGSRIDGQEAEPNDNWQLANRADLSQPVTGRMGVKGETDYFVFDLDSEVTDQQLQLVLDTAQGEKYRFCLLDGRGQNIQCRDGDSQQILPGLVLTAGTWGLSVGRGIEGSEYSITLQPAGNILAGVEVEPNDSVEHAAAVPANHRIKGKISGSEDDFYRFIINEEPQLWRFQVTGDHIHELAYLDGSGKQNQVFRVAGDQTRVRLENVYLLPGIHYIRVSGVADANYTLLARPIGPPDPNGELEPNDDGSRTQELNMEQTRTGLLQDLKDRDQYRFNLQNWDHVQLTIEQAPDAEIFATLYWGSMKLKHYHNPTMGEKVELKGVFPPGDYRLLLSARKTSDAEYKLSLNRLQRFACADDCEPNDNLDFASPLPLSQIIKGRSNEWRDYDWYELPVLDHDSEVVIKADARQGISLNKREYGSNNLLDWNAENNSWNGVIPANTETFIQVSRTTKKDYQLEVAIDGQAMPVLATKTPQISLDTQLSQSTVAAFRPYSQLLEGELKISNTGNDELTLKLESVSSDHRWKVEHDRSELTLKAGESRSIPIKVKVQADAWSGRKVRISSRAFLADGRHVESFVSVQAIPDATTVNATQGFNLPTPLLGGMNVAWSALGGQWLDGYKTDIGDGFETIFDGMAIHNDGLQLRGKTAREPLDVTIEFPGENPQEIAGFVLDLMSYPNPMQYLKDFELALSSDGQQFNTVLVEELAPLEAEQALVLPEPVSARFARLRLKNAFSGTSGSALTLGEFKVITKPGADLSNGQGFDLATPSLGGHVVYSMPAISPSGWDDTLLDDEKAPQRMKFNADGIQEFVIGFHHDRAALITSVVWNKAADQPAATVNPSQVKLSVSVDSPAGPWRPIGQLPMDVDEPQSEFKPEKPEWARFVKFTVAGNPDTHIHHTPSSVHIMEKPSDSGYQSILGEWGFASQAAIYEKLQPLPVEAAFTAAGNDSKATAAELVSEKIAGGQVMLGEHEQWYRLRAGATDNVLTFTLLGDPTVRTVISLETSDGMKLALRKLERLSNTSKHQYEAFVTPAETYFIKVEEPPRNVVFVWDTSASVGAYLPVIYSAMMNYAKGVIPDRDAVNMMPFGSPLLLRDWYGEPYILQTVLNDYPRKESSSAAEATIKAATRALAPLAGTKAIVLITDAATGRDSSMWEELLKVQPRIFALGLGSQGAFGRHPTREQDLMQDWAQINGGHYAMVKNEAELGIAFERASSMLRRPADYTLLAETSFREKPGPGQLLIVAEEQEQLGGAVELILDASGSMLKRMAGKRRIDIAKQVLDDAVNQYIAPGTPVALRVFGHKETNSCRTDLEIALKPLDPAAASKVINAVNAMNLAKTPIADSLAMVASDLKLAQGRKLVVLVTDGEETCEGDAEQVIEELKSQGFDIALNIVGFAIDDAQLENQFESWASLAGGRYFSADNEDGLNQSIQEALQIPFRVFDQSGSEVAAGLVNGDPLELEAGIYRVMVEGSPAKVFETVHIAGEGEVILNLSE